jgi:hypothetical protein
LRVLKIHRQAICSFGGVSLVSLISKSAFSSALELWVIERTTGRSRNKHVLDVSYRCNLSVESCVAVREWNDITISAVRRSRYRIGWLRLYAMVKTLAGRIGGLTGAALFARQVLGRLLVQGAQQPGCGRRRYRLVKDDRLSRYIFPVKLLVAIVIRTQSGTGQ